MTIDLETSTFIHPLNFLPHCHEMCECTQATKSSTGVCSACMAHISYADDVQEGTVKRFEGFVLGVLHSYRTGVLQACTDSRSSTGARPHCHAMCPYRLHACHVSCTAISSYRRVARRAQGGFCTRGVVPRTEHHVLCAMPPAAYLKNSRICSPELLPAIISGCWVSYSALFGRFKVRRFLEMQDLLTTPSFWISTGKKSRTLSTKGVKRLRMRIPTFSLAKKRGNVCCQTDARSSRTCPMSSTYVSPTIMFLFNATGKGKEPSNGQFATHLCLYTATHLGACTITRMG